MRRGDAEDVGPLRPGVRRAPDFGGPGDDLELVDAPAPLAVDGAQAIGAGVAAADDDRRPCRWAEMNSRSSMSRRPPRRFWRVRKSIAKWIPFELASLDRQVAGLGGAAAEADRVELVEQLLRR